MFSILQVTEKRDMFGYWWALLPDSPEVDRWTNDEGSKNTLAYCAVSDPIATSRASVLSVILALLSGSRMYLSQAETRYLFNPDKGLSPRLYFSPALFQTQKSFSKLFSVFTLFYSQYILFAQYEPDLKLEIEIKKGPPCHTTLVLV